MLLPGHFVAKNLIDQDTLCDYYKCRVRLMVQVILYIMKKYYNTELRRETLKSNIKLLDSSEGREAIFKC